METIKRKASLLPVIDLAGTEFFVDVHEREFRQADAPDNRIAMAKIIEDDIQINSFTFDLRTKNVYAGILQPDGIPDYVTLVIIPPLAEIMKKYNREMALAASDKRFGNKERQSDTKTHRHGRHKTMH
jgi:hypothetical protein